MSAFRTFRPLTPRSAVGLWLVLVFTTLGTAGAQSLDEARRLVSEGRLAEAARAFRAAAEATDDPTVEATARNNACVLFNNVGDAPTALPECRRALALRRQLDDTRSLARTLNNLALVEQSLGRFEAAAESFEEALAVNRLRGDSEAETLVRSNLGWLWTSAGRYGKAVEHLEQALRSTHEHGDTPWAAEQRAVARLNYGVVLEKLGAYREALDLYETLRADPGGLDEHRRALVDLNRGVMYRNLGDPLEALAAFESAAQTFEALDDRAGLSNAWLNIGLAHHLNLGRLDQAEEAFERALEEARRSGDLAETLQDLLHLARLRLDRGQLEAAGADLEEALTLAKASGSAEGRWIALDGRARWRVAGGDLVGARRDLEQALELIEGVREGLRDPRRRVGFLGDKRAVYTRMVRVLAELAAEHPGGPEDEQAWEWVQRAKARELLDVVGDGIPPLAARELGPLLGNDVLLELFVADDRLYAWVATSETGLRMHDLGLAAPVLGHAQALHRALAAGEPLPPADLASLSATLLATTHLLEGAPETLWISADGALRRLPFEVLDVAGEKLVDHLAVSYLPNSSALASIRRSESGRESPPPRNPTTEEPAVLAALAAPKLESMTSVGRPGLPTPAEILVRRFVLPPLPGAAHELVAIAETFGERAELLRGESATEAEFRRLATQPGAVLHLATHTLLDDGTGDSAILLTPTAADDGLLWARELSELDVARRLTVLAACRSALDPSDGSDALASLTGAFLAAGSPAVVASLWDVDDGATATFMEQLYHQLGRGLRPAEALRQAKLRLRSDPRWDQPHLWAAFILVGDTTSLTPPSPSLRVWALGILLALLIAWWLYRWRRWR